MEHKDIHQCVDICAKTVATSPVKVCLYPPFRTCPSFAHD